MSLRRMSAWVMPMVLLLSVSAWSGVSDHLDQVTFDGMFPKRNISTCATHNAATIYTYQNFVNAAAAFPQFASEGSATDQKREIAAFLGQISHETTGGWSTAEDPQAWGLCYTEELGCESGTCTGYTDYSSPYTPVAGKTYHGRGPIQLSWNYNYGQASEALFGDASTLLNDPDQVKNDGVLAFKTAIWFWMTRQTGKPSCHDVMLGLDAGSGRLDFAACTNIINGGLECGSANWANSSQRYKQEDRVAYFERFASDLGVSAGSNLYCNTHDNFVQTPWYPSSSSSVSILSSTATSSAASSSAASSSVVIVGDCQKTLVNTYTFNFVNNNDMAAGHTSGVSNGISVGDTIVPEGLACSEYAVVTSMDSYNLYLESPWSGSNITATKVEKITWIESSSSVTISSAAVSSAASSAIVLSSEQQSSALSSVASSAVTLSSANGSTDCMNWVENICPWNGSAYKCASDKVSADGSTAWKCVAGKEGYCNAYAPSTNTWGQWSANGTCSAEASSSTELSSSEQISSSQVVNTAPVFNDTTLTILESQNISQGFAIVVASDAEGDNLTYALLGSSSTFAITSAGVISLKTSVDFETLASYLFEVVVSDGVLKDTASVSINVTNVNDVAPTIAGETISIAESTPVDSVLFTFSTQDSEGDALSYRIFNGNTSLFAVKNNTIELQSLLDFENETQHVIKVEVSDGLLKDSATFTINVSNINDVAPQITDTTLSLSESESMGTLLLSYATQDSEGDALTYTKLSGEMNAFLIENATVKLNQNLDYETKDQYTLQLEVSDGVWKDTASVSINVTNVNDVAPTIAGETISIAESTPVDSVLFTFATQDSEGDALSYRIYDGNTSLFAVKNNTIELQNLLDYENETQHIIKVEVSDGLLKDSATFTINVSNINDVAPQISDTTLSLSESESMGTLLLSYATQDSEGDALTYTKLSGDLNAFLIENATVKLNQNLDYETKDQYTLQLEVSDGVWKDTATITLNVSNENDVPPVFADTVLQISEDATLGTAVLRLEPTDEEGNLTYSIISGNLGEWTIDGDYLKTAQLLDYENVMTFALKIEVFDGVFYDTSEVTIQVQNINDNLPILANATLEITENNIAPIFLGTINATDADGDAIQYFILSGNSGNIFSLDKNTGILEVVQTLDYEQQSSYVLEVAAVAAGDSAKAQVRINVLDEQETISSSIEQSSVIELSSALEQSSAVVVSSALEESSVIELSSATEQSSALVLSSALEESSAIELSSATEQSSAQVLSSSLEQSSIIELSSGTTAIWNETPQWNLISVENGILSIYADNAKSVSLSIVQANGKSLIAQRVSLISGANTFDLRDMLTSGIYYLRVNAFNSKSQILKITIP